MIFFLKKFFIEHTWKCFFRKKTSFILKENQENRQVLKPLLTVGQYWCADPFIVYEKGQYYVFCEMMDCKTSHGILGVVELNLYKKNYVKPVMDFDCHMSYPNVFKYNENWYMIPETCGRKTIELYKAIQFPCKWEKISILKNNLHAVDTTVFEQENKYYVFIYEPNDEHNILSVAELDMENFKLKNITKVKEYSSRIGRPAGNIIKYNGKTYRPTQYGVNYYGEKIVFKEFKFNPITFFYDEKDVKEFTVKDIDLSKRNSNVLGCHTYNSVKDYEIIDIIYTQFSLFRPIRLLLKFLNIGGYKFGCKK